ncbi:hypothetical protein [Winogradskyella ouciana]|uniref:Lipoprotein n=1 Tax=Winogradskyella ouciana TaxID=2608631 RepID=A0A7K1G9U8_9FLAO|nr:hypothetical protein [Winogradskyella ouciana]MTE26070.1 hypothetical protein [Winogradskyella ouciana]
MNTIKHIFKLFLITLTICSCGNDAKKEKEGREVIAQTKKVVKEVPKSNDFREQLKATDPATEAQFQNWLPENLGDFKRSEFTKTRISQNDIASAGAIYVNGDKRLELAIVDGASKDGLLAINSHYMAQNLKLDNTNASGYEKTYERNSLKVLETYIKKDNFYRALFLYNMRFGIKIESHGLNNDELWQVIDTLNLEKLNDL